MATKRWLGSAAATYDLWTIALSGTVTSQTYTFTINSKTVTYTSSGGDTVGTILSALVDAWNASLIPEFAEYTATGLPVGSTFTSMTLTADTAGVPGTISVGTSGAATFTITNTTAGTGPNDFTNAQNWSGGVAPANSDTLVFDNGSIACLFNLSTSLTGIILVVDPGYSGKIGLPFINQNGTTSYNEYRTTSLTLAGGTATINSEKITRCNLAFGANTTTIRVLATSKQRPDPNVPVVLITGGNGSSELDVTKGDVGVAYYRGTTATFPNVKSSFAANPSGDANIVCGSGATLTTVVKQGGNLTLYAGATTITQGVTGGQLTIQDAAAVTTLNLQNGTCNYNSTGTLGTVKVSNDGFLDYDQDPRAKAITNPILVYGNKYRIRDSQKVVNSGVLSVTANQTSKINVEHGSDNVMTFT